MGSGTSQLIYIIVLPLLAKLYAPEQYGTFATFVSITILSGMISTGRYETAIILPESELDALSLLILCFGLSFIASLFSYLAFSLYDNSLSIFLNNSDLKGWLPLLPLSILLTGFYLSLDAWANRKGKYKRMSKARLLLAVTTVLMQLALGVREIQGGLIIGTITGQLITVGWLFVDTLKNDKCHLFIREAKTGIIKMLAHYKSHPAYLIPSHGASTLFIQLPILFCAVIFGREVAGYYAMAMRLVTLPSQILANSIGTVYKQKASIAYRKTGQFLDLFLKTFLTAGILSVLPYAAIVVFADDLLPMLLGESWRKTGEMAQVLALSGWVGFFSTPVDKGAIIVGQMRYIILWQISRLLALATLFCCIYLYNIDYEYFIINLCATGIIFYLIDLCYEYKFAKGMA